MKPMFSHAIAILLISSLSIPSVYAAPQEDDDSAVFLSLTKRAEKLSQLPANVVIINQDKLKKYHSTSITDVLQHETGITTSVTGSAGQNANPSIRGSKSEQVLVLMDGLRMNEVSLGLANLSTLPLEQVERIEVIRGANAAIYGSSAFGGVINIITKKATSDIPQLDVAIGMGPYRSTDYAGTFQVARNNRSILISASRAMTDGYRQNSASDALNLFARGERTTSLGIFAISASYFDSRIGVPGMGIALPQYDGTTEEQASTPNATQKENRRTFQLNHTIDLFTQHQLLSRLYYTSSVRDYTVPSWFSNDRYASNTIGGETQLNMSSDLTLGIEAWQEGFTNTDNITGVKVTDKTRTNTAGYLQKKIAFDALTIIPGIRFDHNDAFGSATSPRLTGIYQLNDSIKLSANAATAWRAPTFNELYWPNNTSSFWGTTYITQGNTDLKPEEGTMFDIGTSYMLPTFKTTITFFSQASRNLISWNSTTSGTTVTTKPENISEAQQTGVEYELSHKIASQVFHSLNYTYLYAEDTINKLVLNYRPYNTINYDLTIHPSVVSLITARIHHVGGQYTWNATYPDLPSYTTLDMRASYTINESAEFWIQGDNLTDARYQTRLYYPLPGRTFSAGVKVRFLN